jgi:hypothetical protein
LNFPFCVNELPNVWNLFRGGGEGDGDSKIKSDFAFGTIQIYPARCNADGEPMNNILLHSMTVNI